MAVCLSIEARTQRREDRLRVEQLFHFVDKILQVERF